MYWLKASFLFALFAYSMPIHAAMEVSDAEWAAWPSFCRAGYLRSSYGVGSRFRGRLSDADLNAQSSASSGGGNVGIPGVHHFCMGMVYVNRGRYITANAKKSAILRQALGEFDYSFSRMSPTASTYSMVTAYYGKALYHLGRRQEAVDMWSKGISAKPASRESFLAWTEALLAEKKPKEALELLQRYDAAKEFESADAEAFFAHAYLELGDTENASIHMEKAYQLGYPFPGLRSKIERVSEEIKRRGNSE